MKSEGSPNPKGHNHSSAAAPQKGAVAPLGRASQEHKARGQKTLDPFLPSKLKK